MKRVCLYIFLIILFMYDVLIWAQAPFKWVNVGSIRTRVLDNGHQSETESGKADYQGVATYYFDGHDQTGRLFSRWADRNNGLYIGVRNWKDTVGIVYPYMTAGAEHGTSDAERIMFVIPDSKGNTIYKYMRYKPPTITVDGIPINDPFPFDETDLVEPSKIPGTADVMVESNIRTWIGMDIHQKVYAWSQKNHDDYVIYDLVFKNTGNVDRDPEIELPNQVLDSVYIMRAIGWQPARSRNKEWVSWYGARPNEDIRIMYFYPQRQKATAGKSDDFGGTKNDRNQPRIYGPQYGGEVTLFVSKEPNDMVNDDFNQPQMHSVYDYRVFYVKENPLVGTHWSELPLTYDAIKRGIWPQPGYFAPLMTDARPGKNGGPSYHEVPMDERDMTLPYTEDINPKWGAGGYHELATCSYGPFTLNPGDSIRIVYAIVMGSISKRKAFEVGRNYYNKKAVPPPGCSWNNGNPIDNLPPQYKKFPDLYKDVTYGDEVAWAKDCWVATGKDSLFMNARAAQWNIRQNFNIPTAPPPPSIEVRGRSNAIRIKWGNESESAPDFAGYRVYRAIGSYTDSAWVKIFECTKANLVHQYDDTSAVRGTSYYYYVTAFDDGISNAPDFHGKKEVLESSMWANMTTQPAMLARQSSDDLDKIRVVPNPFSLGAVKIQYPGDLNKIMFLNLPPECTIRIFTESGDLVKTIEHTSGSGDESWGIIPNEHQTTTMGQRPVSGLYIANITTPDGRTKNVKFIIVR